MSIEKKIKTFYITTPIYYANAKPHIGHAYTTVATDVLARWNKLNGLETFFLTGSDEHGLKIQKKAEEAGSDPKQFVDKISDEFKLLWEKLSINYDNFIRTTDSAHKKAVQKTLQALWDKQAIYKGDYEGLYCVGCEQFKTETELVDGKCPDHNAVPEKLKEECYLLKMAEMQNALIEKIEVDEFCIAPNKYKVEILSFLKNQKLKDISISRKNVSWGIPLPFDSSHSTYVWVDAFLNYLTGLGWDGDSKKIPSQWPPNVQLIGKDILRVHATIWPIILMHLGISLPKKLFTHGHILAGGKKMSKTLGNVIAVDEMIEKFGVDATRYLLMSAGTFGEDVDLTMERAKKIYEADLVNGLGNLVARSLAMAEKMQAEGGILKVENGNKKSKMESEMDNFWKKYEEAVNSYRLNEAMNEVRKLIGACDEYIEEKKPWKLEGEEKEEAIYGLLESLRHVAWMIRPFMPETSDKIFAQLFADEKERVEELSKPLNDAQKWGGLKPDTKIKKGEGIFPRLAKV